MAVIMIVDDDPALRLIATDMLRSGNHAILEAADGVEALKLLRSMPVDLVVLDMLMPNKDGLETILEIRRCYRDVRVLAISSGGRGNPLTYLQLATAFGADDTMVKPLRAAAFCEVVGRLLTPAPMTVPDPIATGNRSVA